MQCFSLHWLLLFYWCHVVCMVRLLMRRIRNRDSLFNEWHSVLLWYIMCSARSLKNLLHSRRLLKYRQSILWKMFLKTACLFWKDSLLLLLSCWGIILCAKWIDERRIYARIHVIWILLTNWLFTMLLWDHLRIDLCINRWNGRILHMT